MRIVGKGLSSRRVQGIEESRVYPSGFACSVAVGFGTKSLVELGGGVGSVSFGRFAECGVRLVGYPGLCFGV